MAKFEVMVTEYYREIYGPIVVEAPNSTEAKHQVEAMRVAMGEPRIPRIEIYDVEFEATPIE